MHALLEASQDLFGVLGLNFFDRSCFLLSSPRLDVPTSGILMFFSEYHLKVLLNLHDSFHSSWQMVPYNSSNWNPKTEHCAGYSYETINLVYESQ